MSIEQDLLTVRRGTVTAPAGCGKTQVIAEALRRYQGHAPVLVLTHTNAGVNALRTRLHNLDVPTKSYRAVTIDGFAMRLAATFPRRSGVSAKVLQLNNAKTDYPAIRQAAIQLIHGHHLDDVLAATYGRLLVDEYQDCSLTQHRIIDGLAEALPTCVLGDPMQAIFGFAEPLVNWKTDVLARFPPIGELETPWRWINATNKELGIWLLDARRMLEAGGSIDLRTAPKQVELVVLKPADASAQRMMAARTKAATANGSVMIIGDSIKVAGRHQVASQTPGATIVEAVDLKDLIAFGRNFNPAAASALEDLLNFGGSLMTKLDVPGTKRRIASLRSGRAKNPATPMEAGLMAFEAKPTLRSAQIALTHMREHDDVRVYRPELLRRCLSALEAASDGSCTLHEAAIREREKFRHRGRPLSKRHVGSTLLLKGLEAEVVVILQPELMDARHLYVALTRASHRVVVCSAKPILVPLLG